MKPTSGNRLLQETSPYLRQHAQNPVDWFPWGEEALQKARSLDRPIFLSIGYSACHWCHVMEHESFEDPQTAALLNDHFISIKVDREERPDLDQIYMTAVQLLTRQGGWPMSMFLTPDLKPFFGGTYFPPDDRYGRPSFRRVLAHIIKAWKENRGEIDEQAANLTQGLQSFLQMKIPPGKLDPELLRNAGNHLARAFDQIHGGFGSAPKFPHPMEIRLLLRIWKRFGDESALTMAFKTLDHMAHGGIYDHLGGGFHRYSTDARWLVPHFEKMLYDNALLTTAYLEAHQATGQPFYRQVVEETLSYILRDMTSPAGPFYSTLDADSEGEEGKFYVWTPGEVERILGKTEADLFGQIYDVSPEGNWEGHTILNRARSDEQEARLLQVPEGELRERLVNAKKKLLAVRNQRIWPGRDEKILTSWNGLMIAAFAQAGQVLHRLDYIGAAARAADFILKNMRQPDGRLFHTATVDSPAKLNGYLEDYAFFIDALISLYESTFEPRWIENALDLAQVMTDQFWDVDEGSFFYTGKDHEQLIARVKDVHDSSIPSGNAMAATSLLRLAKLTGNKDFWEKAEKTMANVRQLLAESPMAGGQMLVAADFFLGPVQEFAIVGNPEDEETRQVLALIHQKFRPNKVLALKGVEMGKESAERPDKVIPLLEGKTSQGTVTTYICQDFTCQQPLVGAGAVEMVLG